MDIFSMKHAFYILVYSFFFYSFAGWCVESVFATILEHRFVNRGFLYGPLCPIYGCGVLFIVLASAPARGNWLLIFFVCFFGCSLLEYLTSLALEIIFHSKWWDYSANRFNINGRICLSYSLLWGAAGLAAVLFINPPVCAAIQAVLKYPAGYAAAFVLLAYLATDLTATLKKLVQFKKLLRQLEDITNEIKVRLLSIKLEPNELDSIVDKLVKPLKAGHDRLENLSSGFSERYDIFEKMPRGSKARFFPAGSPARIIPDLKIPAELKTRFVQTVNKLYTSNSRLFTAFPKFNSKRIKDAFLEIREKLKNAGK